MIDVPLLSDGGPASAEAIERAEQDMGVSIPACYRAFLRAHDGARPKTNHFTGASRWTAGVTAFLGVGPYDDAALVRAREAYRERVPPTMLVVAEVEGGNLICIELEGDDPGAVFIWDHEEEADPGEPPRFDNLHRLADSFREYAAGLSEVGREDVGPPPTQGWVDPAFLDEIKRSG